MTPEQLNRAVDDLLQALRGLPPGERQAALDRLRSTQPEVCARAASVLSGRATVSFPDLTPPAPVPAGPLPTLPYAPAPAGGLPDIPGYEILGELGRGGMGAVYKARNVNLKRLVALKVILAAGYADRATVQRFRAEAETVARLQHPNIVQIFQVGEHAGRPYLELEYAAGGSLDRQLNGAPCAAGPSAEVVRTLALAVQHAHERGVVHRDLKPSNVLLAACGLAGEPAKPQAAELVPKLTDFGLAKQLDASAQTASGAILGTPSYMAPEQAQGKAKEVGPAADIYALGAILYELLTGRPPFRAATPLDTVLQVATEEPVAPRQLNRSIPRDLETVCLKCLHKSPPKRYASAAGLADDLGRFLAGQPVRARPVGRPERAWRWCRRNPGLAASLAVAVLALVLGAGVATWFAVEANAALANERQARRERALAQAEALLAAGPEAVPALLAGLQPLPPEVRARLRAVWQEADGPAARPRRLRAGLGLLASEAATVKAQLSAWLLEDVEPREFLLLRDGLRPYAAELKARLWEAAEGPASTDQQRFRALVALAAYDPGDARWPRVGPRVVHELLSDNELHIGLWAEALRPVSQTALLAPLAEVSRGRRLAERRHVAATLLSDYAADRPELLAEVALEAEPRQWATLFPKLAAHRERALALLRRELAQPAPPPAEVAARELLARRQAQAAVGLLQLGAGSERVWRLLRHAPEPDLRTYLLHGLGRLGTPVEVVLKRLEREQDAGALQALILSLGEYGPAQLPPARRGPLAARLLGWYRTHPNPGVHGAIDWLLRHGSQGTPARKLDWGRAASLAKIDAELAGRPAGPKGWYVTGKEGHTLAIVRGPAEFVMGSPDSEPGRSELTELQQRWRIPRSFAIATREVTVAQFQRFVNVSPEIRKHFNYLRDFSPDKDGPQVGVTWYEAAAYCNWLSKREGLPEKEWVYGSGPIRAGIELPRDWRRRKGYRLPTEAEWEYACRAGVVTSRYHGTSEEMLAEYAWYATTSQDRAWPVGQLKPNGLGLFDMLGNAVEWTQDPAVRYPRRRPGEVIEDGRYDTYTVDDSMSRRLRGGNFTFQARFVRCAYRTDVRPDFSAFTVGLRVARTYD